LSANVAVPMNSAVSHSTEPLVVESSAGELSPELVLVDPSLAERARSSMPGPADTFARLDGLARARPEVVPTRPAREPVLPQPPTTPLTAPPVLAWGTRPTSTARTALLAGGVAAVLAISLLVGVRVDVGGQTAGAESTAVPAAPTRVLKPKATKKPARVGATRHAGTAGSRRQATSPARSAAPSRHRFAWAPTEGAAGYDVEFFRDGARVYVGHTTQTTIEIPATWRYDGTAHSFRAGEYGWYVWPVIDGRRAARASVQTTVSIPHA
jgi:hypothetical protein